MCRDKFPFYKCTFKCFITAPKRPVMAEFLLHLVVKKLWPKWQCLLQWLRMLTAFKKKPKTLAIYIQGLQGNKETKCWIYLLSLLCDISCGVVLSFDSGLDFTLRTTEMVQTRAKERANDFALQACFLAILYSSAPLETKRSMCIFLYENKLCLKKTTENFTFSMATTHENSGFPNW